jgi:hypothetical protein
LCATLLKHEVGQDDVLPSDRFLWLVQPRFSPAPVAGTSVRCARMLGRKPGRWLVRLCRDHRRDRLVLHRLPGSFLPSEDQGYFISIVQLPPGATQERTSRC